MSADPGTAGAWNMRAKSSSRFYGECVFKDPQIPVVNNVDAEIPQKRFANPGQTEPPDLQPGFVEAVHGATDRGGIHHFVEVGPKKVLRGLMRRIDRNVKVLSVEDDAMSAIRPTLRKQFGITFAARNIPRRSIIS